MEEKSSDFRDTLLELIDSSPAPVDHPSADRWLAYHRGELSAEEEETLQEHLVRCRDCFELAAAAASFTQSEEEQGAGEEMETAAQWRLLRPQLDLPPSNVREISVGPRRRPARWSRLPSSLAASFFVALVGMTGWNLQQRSDLEKLTSWNLQQRSDLERLRAPKPNAPVIDFSAGERLLGPDETTRSVPAGTTLAFHPPTPEELPVYRLTARDSVAGRELWSYPLRLNRDSALTLQLPEGLPPGLYLLELADGSGGRAGRLLKQYRLRVTEPGRGD